MHITSLPSNFGIGTFGKAAFEFVDFLSEAGLKLWQILPICSVDEFGSPYQSFSTFAGNSLLIDLEFLADEGLIDLAAVEKLRWGFDETVVCFDAVRTNKEKILKEAFKNWVKINGCELLKNFAKTTKWLYSYSVFMALFHRFKKEVWWNWPDEFKFIDINVLEKFFIEHELDVLYFVFEQFIFFKQWRKLKQYANKKGIHIVGDLPIYVSGNSADVWANPRNFCLDEELKPKRVAGCPPDAFSDDGQLWGNPIYDWDELKKSDYEWWIERFDNYFKMFDVVRVDHFRGFESFYSINAKRKNAREGEWVQGPGLEFFKQVERKLGKLNIIAEDLGFLTDATRRLLQQTGFCGMKVLQFAFDPREKSVYLPHTYISNSVCYTGTHDNNTAVGWFKEINEESRNYCRNYLNFKDEPINWVLIRAAMASVCRIAIVPMQDFLGLDETCRMNTPGTIKNNWSWRLTKSQRPSSDLIEKIEQMIKLYGR